MTLTSTLVSFLRLLKKVVWRGSCLSLRRAAKNCPIICMSNRSAPRAYREQATFYTDDWEAYKGALQSARHQDCAKGTGRTNAVERFNCTLRQRVARLVREALSFSKKRANHIGAIKYFICQYKQEVLRRT